MNSKANADYKDLLKNAQTKSIEAVTTAIATAQQQADEMGPSDIFATVCTVTAVLIASYQII